MNFLPQVSLTISLFQVRRLCGQRLRRRHRLLLAQGDDQPGHQLCRPRREDEEEGGEIRSHGELERLTFLYLFEPDLLVLTELVKKTVHTLSPLLRSWFLCLVKLVYNPSSVLSVHALSIELIQ